jgi:hypothetical protein
MRPSRPSVAVALIAALFAWSGAAPAQQCSVRPNLMLCGSSDRPLSGLHAAPYNEVSGCSPDGSTQAMLVTRNATIAGNGAAWLAYLNAGGRIITEYSNSANVYNELYGTAYPDGSQAGACYDSPMPSAKLNLANAFWVQNNIPPTPSGSEGCGYDLAALVAGEPTVTALGARASDTAFVNFAIRPQGAGTLFLLEGDWQDTDTVPLDANNLAFLDALIAACGSPKARNVAAVPVGDPFALAGVAGLLALLGAGFARLRRRRAG